MKRLLQTLTILLLINMKCSQIACAQESLTTAEVGGRPLQLELSVPEGPGPHPLIIWIHGGGWVQGSHQKMPPFTPFALEAGFAVASLDYRLASEGGTWGDAPTCWPAQLSDCKAGIRWLRANASSQRLDPDRFYAWGHSAGGHLATMLALTNDEPAFEGTVGSSLNTSSRVDAAVDFAGPSDLFRMNQDHDQTLGPGMNHDGLRSGESQLLGANDHGHSLGSIRNNQARSDWPWKRLRLLCLSASPAEQVDEEDRAPLLIVHGAQDRLVPVAQAHRLASACAASEVPHATIILKKAGHNLFASQAPRLALEWLKSMAFEETIIPDDD